MREPAVTCMLAEEIEMAACALLGGRWMGKLEAGELERGSLCDW